MAGLSRQRRSARRWGTSARSVVAPGNRRARANSRGPRFLSERTTRGSGAVSAPGGAMRARLSEPDRAPDPLQVGTLARVSRRIGALGAPRAAGRRAILEPLRRVPRAALPVRLSGSRLRVRIVRCRSLREARVERRGNGVPRERVPRAARLSGGRRVHLCRAAVGVSHACVSRLGQALRPVERSKPPGLPRGTSAPGALSEPGASRPRQKPAVPPPSTTSAAPVVKPASSDAR
jgi:hypothetical protein